MFYIPTAILHQAPRTNLLKKIQGMRDGGKLLQPSVSAERLVDLLIQDKFETGQHVDYYDEGKWVFPVTLLHLCMVIWDISQSERINSAKVKKHMFMVLFLCICP